MLIPDATQIAQLKMPSVMALAVPITRPPTTLSLVVMPGLDAVPEGRVSGRVVGRVIVAVLMASPSSGAGRPVRGEPDRPTHSIHYRIEYVYAS